VGQSGLACLLNGCGGLQRLEFTRNSIQSILGGIALSNIGSTGYHALARSGCGVDSGAARVDPMQMLLNAVVMENPGERN
jgi:hypothetical protein